MRKKSAKKLSLSRETVVQLDDTLRGVAGGCDNVSGCPECRGSNHYTACLSCVIWDCIGRDED